MANTDRITILGGILSYPNLYSKEKYEGTETDNFSASIILPPGHEAIEQIYEMGNQLAIDTLGKANVPKRLWESARCSFKPGRDEFEDHMILKGTNRKRILTIDRAKNQVGLDDGEDQYNGIFYPGCTVNFQVDFWMQAARKDVRANLYCVQFVGDGERLGGSGPDADSVIGDMPDMPDDDEGSL